MTKTIGEHLVAVLNEYLEVEEIDGDRDGVHYIIAKPKLEDFGTLLIELMGVIDRCAPPGKVCVVQEKVGFSLVDETNAPRQEVDSQ